MKAGTSTTLFAPFEAFPVPIASVAFNGDAVRDAKRIMCKIVENKISLAVQKVEKLDAGEYVVTAENVAGKTTLAIRVIVLGEYSKN